MMPSLDVSSLVRAGMVLLAMQDVGCSAKPNGPCSDGTPHPMSSGGGTTSWTHGDVALTRRDGSAVFWREVPSAFHSTALDGELPFEVTRAADEDAGADVANGTRRAIARV